MDYTDSYNTALKAGVDCLWVFPTGEVKYTPSLEKLIIK